MKTIDPSVRRGEKGFTLVELAIVMIIIGLLIGGILKGQELIANAQLTSTIAQVNGINAALSTFRDKYSSLPGDMPNAGNRLPNCANTCATGTGGSFGNGRIDTPAFGTVPGAGSEALIAFTHLAAADLISGVTSDFDGNGIVQFGSLLPAAKIGGGYWVSWTNGGTGGGVAGDLRAGHYLALNGTVANVGDSTGSLSPSQAAQIDRKIDDGVANSGGVQSNSGGSCQSSGIYNEKSDTGLCALYLRVQG